MCVIWVSIDSVYTIATANTIYSVEILIGLTRSCTSSHIPLDSYVSRHLFALAHDTLCITYCLCTSKCTKVPKVLDLQSI